MKKESFLRTVAEIAIPVGLQSMLQSSFAMVDQLMVGQLGSTAVAAVEVAGRPAFIFSFVTGAVATVTGIMVAQYLGMHADGMVDRSLSVNFAAAGLTALLFMAVCGLFPGQIVQIFTEDAAIGAAGQAYLRLIVWTFLPMSFSSILAVPVRCMGHAVWTLWAGIASALMNTGLNYLLIFGRGGFPALGVTGAAAASVISQFVNLLLILGMFLRLRRGFRFSLSLGANGTRAYLVMLLPVLLNELLWSVGQSVNTFLYGHMADGDLASMSITGPVQGLFIGALSGISQAAGILIGGHLGAGERDGAYRRSKQLLGYGFIGSLALSALLLWLRGAYVRLYNIEENVRATASLLLVMFAVLAPVKVANMILGGVVRSGGKTTLIMVIDTVGTWLVGIPLGFVSAFLLHLPIAAVYFLLSQEELVRLLMTLYVFRTRRWMQALDAPGQTR